MPTHSDATTTTSPYQVTSRPTLARARSPLLSVTEAVQRTCVSPKRARHEPSAYLATPGSRVTSRIASVAQETPHLPDPAIDFVLSGDVAVHAAIQAEANAFANEDWEAVAEAHHRLEELNGYDASARAGRLLHGLGFAGALAEVGLPTAEIPLALFSFNVGVEIGQLVFVGAVLAVMAVAWRAGQRLRFSQPAWLWRVAPYAIGALASFWLVERVAAF